jgi:transcriptional regulator with XRE-family HTH domain
MTPETLRETRTRLGLSQDQLAKALGVSTNTVARWERGALTIGTPAMLALALESLERRRAAE